MQAHLNVLFEYIKSTDIIFLAAKAVLILLFTFLVLSFTRRRVTVFVERNPSFAVAKPVTVFVIWGLCGFTILHTFGINLSVLLGAAGVFTVAIGFASQTSASNLISGLFLLAERPFNAGDVVTVGDVTGEVLAVNLLSTHIRKFDNLLVRVPNESLLKSNITNLTYFEIRRADLQLTVAYREDLERVEAILRELVTQSVLCLDEPAPVFILLGYGESAVQCQFSVWVDRSNFLDARNGLYRDIKSAFEDHGIEIPFPQRVVHLASDQGPRLRSEKS